MKKLAVETRLITNGITRHANRFKVTADELRSEIKTGVSWTIKNKGTFEFRFRGGKWLRIEGGKLAIEFNNPEMVGFTDLIQKGAIK